MSETMVVLDRSRVREGKLEDLKRAVEELAEFVAANEPRPISYNVYFNDDGSEMVVLQVHPDAASMEHHMRIAGPAFPTFAGLVELRSMEVFGSPSEALLDLIRHKIELLGDATVMIHEHRAGFDRHTER